MAKQNIFILRLFSLFTRGIIGDDICNKKANERSGTFVQKGEFKR